MRTEFAIDRHRFALRTDERGLRHIKRISPYDHTDYHYAFERPSGFWDFYHNGLYVRSGRPNGHVEAATICLELDAKARLSVCPAIH